MLPVRTPQNHSGSFTGKFPSIKMERMIHFESGVEKDWIYLMEHNKEISGYVEQPFCIEYRIENKVHKYTPDFMAVINGEWWLFECKPQKFVDTPKNRIKFSVAETFCQDNSYHFKVIIAEEIRAGSRLKNVKYLTGFSRIIVHPELMAKIVSFFSSRKSAKLKDFVEAQNTYSSREIYPALFYCLYHHVLEFNIDTELLAPNSEAWLFSKEENYVLPKI